MATNRWEKGAPPSLVRGYFEQVKEAHKQGDQKKMISLMQGAVNFGGATEAEAILFLIELSLGKVK
jgi:hypothetical protein